MSKQYMFSAINPKGERVHKRRSDKRDFIKDDFRKFAKQRLGLTGSGAGAIAVGLIKSGEPVEINGWVVMIETRTDADKAPVNNHASPE